jgi:hypothetical protein
MYHPISLPVLRQSLKQANIPTWKSIKTLAQERRLDGKIITSYSATFSFLDFQIASMKVARIAGIMMPTFGQLFESAFCEDVRVTEVIVHGYLGDVIIIFTTCVPKKVTYEPLR